ncbi:lysophospholipase [Chitinibacter sp. SCUT-21]|uniref:alpha/beta hydrolase n=1 Tax=Chitinibacter sp. SCUT-21 TaxID=2970891 RepID=UPI0035A580F7
MGILKEMTLALTLGLITPHSIASQAEIQTAGPEGLLRGTLTTAQNPNSITALIIPGSGPTDRDGNNPFGLNTNTYKLLAEELAAQGITTLRIDKRGMFGSEKAISNPNAVTIDDYASDVQSWISALRQQTDAKCVWLIGHSEGGLVSLVTAQRSKDICGLVLVASAGRPLGVLIREQLKSNPANAPILKDAISILEKLESGHKVDKSKINSALLSLFHPEVQGFLINELTFDPAKLIGNIKKPILILQGLRDIQVGVADAKLLKKANLNSQLIFLKDTNHVLKTVKSDDRNENIKTYSNLLLPLADDVTKSISSFIKSNNNSKSE